MIKKWTASELIKGDEILRRPANTEPLIALLDELITTLKHALQADGGLTERARRAKREEELEARINELARKLALDQPLAARDHTIRAVGGLTERDDECNKPSDGRPVVVKKYGNRRLYNTATSSYIALDDLARMIKNGGNLAAYDAKTGEDITRSVLTQIRHDVVDEAVPELGLKLLPFLLPRKLRDNVAGDLAQDFQDYVAKFGRTYAVRWYWWELGWLCVSRLSPTAIVAAIAFWLRRKIGF